MHIQSGSVRYNMRDKNKFVVITYNESKETKEWLDANTGKREMGKFIRDAIKEKIEKMSE